MRILTPRPLALRKRQRSLIDVELDPIQRAAVDRPAGGAMLVLGEAGHGKTTFALHRLAHLVRSASPRFRALVIVPHAGLERLLQPLVTRLGVNVDVRTYEWFARLQAQRSFGDIPRRESVSVPAGVLRMKRAAALRVLLRKLAVEPPGRIDDDEDAPPPRTDALAQRGDLQHLFGDARRMRWLAQRIGIGPGALAETLEHTRMQFSLRSEDAYAHVVAERLRTLDRDALDASGPAENAGSIDTEDYAVLFELDRLRANLQGRKPMRPRRFDCIAIDEAQEFAPLELALIGRSLARDATLIVAGDADQQTDETTDFRSWDASMRLLRAPLYATVQLEISHRCPPQVVALARALRAGQPPAASVPLLRFAAEAELCGWLARDTAALAERDPRASICVIVRTHALAKRIADGLRGRVPCKLVRNGEFVFHRGVDVTTLDQVKGLEFDYVIVADANADAYPSGADARRALYVAVTRVRHQLVLGCVGEPSPQLPPASEWRVAEPVGIEV